MSKLALVAGFVAVGAFAVALRSEAQPTTAPKPVQPPLAPRVLAEVEANYQKPQHLSATFEQTVTNAVSGQALPASGTLLVEKPNKLKFVFMQPKKAVPKPKATYLFDGKVMWLIDHPNLQYGQKAAANSDLPSLVAFFLGAGTLARDFDVSMTTEGLALVPKKPSAAYAKILLSLDAKKFVTQATIIDSSGNTQTMKFTSTVFDKPAPAGTFVFDPTSVSGYKQLK